MTCATCSALQKALDIVTAQLETKDRQIERLLKAVLPESSSQTPITPAPQATVDQAPSEMDLRRQMADFVDELGQPCLMMDGQKVLVEEYQRVARKLDFEMSGGKLA